MIVEVMGRNAGHIALHGGLAGGADVVLIPEIPYDPARIAEKILARVEHGRRYSVVIVSEGARRPRGRLVYRQGKGENEFEDRLGGVSYRVAEELRELTKLEVRNIVLGHLQRGGTPEPVRPRARLPDGPPRGAADPGRSARPDGRAARRAPHLGSDRARRGRDPARRSARRPGPRGPRDGHLLRRRERIGRSLRRRRAGSTACHEPDRPARPHEPLRREPLAPASSCGTPARSACAPSRSPITTRRRRWRRPVPRAASGASRSSTGARSRRCAPRASSTSSPTPWIPPTRPSRGSSSA